MRSDSHSSRSRSAASRHGGAPPAWRYSAKASLNDSRTFPSHSASTDADSSMEESTESARRASICAHGV
eukprot:206523-Prymnesium_polylepis.1